MSFTPTEWAYSYAELRCIKCGRWLTQCGQAWDKAEQEASNTKQSLNHKCGQVSTNKKTEEPLQSRIEKAAEVMRLIRKNNNLMSFEEEMDKYKILMKTYKL
jgi:hypothetical protein